MLTNLQLNQPELIARVKRDPSMPMARITLLCGPNGSGKSTTLDGLHALVMDVSQKWTAETAPVLADGEAKGVCFVSSEWDNPRLFAKRGADGRQVHSQLMTGSDFALGMLMRERSHGQSNYDHIQHLLKSEAFDVLVLDEPENALDLDGLIWLHQEIRKSEKQCIVATHNLLLLSLANSTDACVNVFGGDPAYLERILKVYGAAVEGRSLGRPKARLKLPKLPESKPMKRPSFAKIKPRKASR